MRRFIFLKSFLRSIAQKPGRFLALLAIVALGAGFYAGLRMTAPDMEHALDAYLDDTSASDIRIISSLGLTDQDIEALCDIQGIECVNGAYMGDAQVILNDATYTMRFHSLPDELRHATSDGILQDGENIEDYPDQIMLIDGRWPASVGECVICADCILDDPYSLGDVVFLKDKREESSIDEGETVSQSEDFLASSCYTIVGFVRTPRYVSQVNLGSTTVGSGSLDQYAYILPEDFSHTDLYSEVCITVKGARDALNDSDAYWKRVNAVIDSINEIAPEREQARLDEIEAQAIADLKTELEVQGVPFKMVEQMIESSDVLQDIRSQLPDSCEWIVLDREKSVGTESFISDAERVDHIASVFPFVFLLVAALVALTTMTRLVDEDRILIGTFKALGYSRTRITFRYVGYALLASGVGASIGILVLSQILPYVIMNAYGIMYKVPADSYPIDAGIAVLSWTMAVGIVLFATWFSVIHTLSERPAALMLPPAPKVGKRILLEKIKPLWRHSSFSWKVTLRNLFRYKKRAIMTLFGIAGCSALLLTGLGLHNAVNDIIDIHFTDIVHYNMTLSQDREANAQDVKDVDDVLGGSSYVSSYTRLSSESYLIQTTEGSQQRVSLTIPEDPDTFETLMTLRGRERHDRLSLQDGKVLINEKLANDIGIRVGDTVTIMEQDSMGNATGTSYEFEVGGVYEAYINNMMLATEEAYRDTLGSDPIFNVYYAKVPLDEEIRESLLGNLEQLDSVNTVSYTDQTIDTYRKMLRSVDLIVVVLIVSAALLAFIVLYNITNINIEERIREIATLKVLGFTPHETDAYIFREVIVLALVGSLIGLLIGIPLESFVVTTAEVDMVMFGRTIHEMSFVVAFFVTMGFTILSLCLMLPKIAHIDMVSSLKSNE